MSLIDEIAEINEEALTCYGFDEAIIGMAERINLGPVVAYSVEKNNRNIDGKRWDGIC